MMGFDDICISFALSIVSGHITDKIKGNRTLEDRISICFKRALKKWNVLEETRDILKSDSLKYYTDLQDYLNDETKGRHPMIKELLRLWVKEMQQDEICSNFIITHKQELTNSKLNEALSLLKEDLSPKLNEISIKQDSMNVDIHEILIQVQLLSQDGNKNLTSSIVQILNGPINSLIEDLKLDSARKIINELEKQFSTCIQSSDDLKSDILFRKGQTLVITDSNKATGLMHEAYRILPQNEEYKKHEIIRLLRIKEYENAEKIASSLLNESKCEYLVQIVCSNNEALAYDEAPKYLRDDYDFRQTLLECLIKKESIDVDFLFIDEDIKTPKDLYFSTLNEWFYVLSYYREKYDDIIFYTFDHPLIKSLKPGLEAINSFFSLISKTEIGDNLPINSCIHCYWNYIYSRNSHWIDMFQKIDRFSLTKHQFLILLMEASMLMLAERFEEAFTVIVSASKDINYYIVQFAIVMSMRSDNIMYLRWILEIMIENKILVDSNSAIMIAYSLNKDRSIETKSILQNIDFEVVAEKHLLLELCDFYNLQKVNISTFKDNVSDMCDELKAYAANLLAYSGDTQMAFDMLIPIVDENVPDIKREMFISVLSKMQDKAPDLYRILVNNRLKGNYCDDQLLKIEYQLDSRIADHKNAFSAIELLYNRHPKDPEIFVHYIYTLAHISPEKLSKYKKQALQTEYDNSQQEVMAYHVFINNGFLETALELLYKAAKSTEDSSLRTFYHSETTHGMLSGIARKEYDIAEEGSFVLCDRDGKRLFYKATKDGSDIGKKLLGVKKDDIVNAKIALDSIRMVVIGIYNKYYKLTGDIIKEASDGSNPELIPFQIDLDHPLESIQNILRNLSEDELTPAEKWELACEKYENGEVGLLQLVDDDNILAGYYKLLFSNFNVNVNSCYMELQFASEISDNTLFVLDIPTIISFAEFTAKTEIQINGPMAITTVVYDFINLSNKSPMRIYNSEFFEAINSGKLFRYDDYVDIDVKLRIQALLDWVNAHCNKVISEQALSLSPQDYNTPLKNQIISSLSMLLKPNTYFVTDDKKFSSLLKMPKIITTETFVRLFNDENTSLKYSEFLFENNFVGVELSELYIEDEYQKMKNHNDNSMTSIMKNILKNPYSLYNVINVCLKLASSECDLNTLKITITNMFTMSLKGFDKKTRIIVIEYVIMNLNDPRTIVQFTKQCFIAAVNKVNNNTLD